MARHISFVHSSQDSFANQVKLPEDATICSLASKPGPKLKVEPAASSRQERNRQAQRLHRTRQASYVRRLEAEVQQLRQNCIQLSTEKDYYRSLSTKRGGSLASPASTTGSVVHDFALRDDDSPPLDSDTIIGSSFGSGLSGSSGTEPTFSSPSSSVGTFDEGDENLGIGVEYVLSMERKCMGHIMPLDTEGENYLRTDRPDGHALMLSWLRISPGQQMPSEGSTCSASSGGDSPKEVKNKYKLRQVEIDHDHETGILRKLLALSSKLPMNEEEMTPVSAWHFLSQHPRFKDINHSYIQDYLSEHVECQGFGATIKRQYIEELVDLCFEGLAEEQI